MKKIILSSFFALCFLIAYSTDINWKEGFVTGNPEIKSMSSIVFGPDHILFIGDAMSAQVVAIDLTDHVAEMAGSFEEIENVDELLATKLGTTKDQFEITDMAVHSKSKHIFLTVQHGNGQSMLFKVNGGMLDWIDLTDVSFSKMNIAEPVAEDAMDRRERPLRKWAISDIAYDNGKVLLTGLSNKEFGSTFRSMDFPFKDEQSFGSLEIYHAAHGQYETNSPVKAFTTVQLQGEPHVIASYTCTPLVIFPMSDLKTGNHTKGRTIAELGNWNTPLDIIELESEGERYILIANSSRALMKISVADIEAFDESLTTPVEERSATAGVDFIALPFVNVLQLDRYEDNTFVMLQRTSEGDLVLKQGASRWL
ncbi:hypothetical protein [Portibacter marinus]|uniref:hypothetical protein n=1 Tax=Portibacter marinus TaxID=2898660 RepID=UPI001F3EB29B|nr:hypothetical protein [Portibacter marinus]